MIIAELKAEVDRLSPDEREELTSYLIFRDRLDDPRYIEKLSQKIDDKNPANWITLDEAEKRLFPAAEK